MSTHKHLGIICSHDLSWSIGSILANAYAFKKLGLLKNLQFKVSPKTLLLLNAILIRPLLEYASEVWSRCLNQDSEGKK